MNPAQASNRGVRTLLPSQPMTFEEVCTAVQKIVDYRGYRVKLGVLAADLNFRVPVKDLRRALDLCIAAG